MMNCRLAPIVALLAVTIALLFAHPAPVFADGASLQAPLPSICVHQIGPGQAYGPAGGNFIDPIREVCRISHSWIDPAKNIAMDLLIGLLAVEFTFVGIQTGLFKNDLSELIGTVTFKVFVSCLMIWLISNADSFLYGIVQGFEYAGRNITGVEGHEGSEIGTVVGFFLSAGVILAERAGALQSQDLAMAGSPLTNTPGAAAYANIVAQQHNQHAAIIGFLALVLLASAGTILLQYFLITAESFIVLFGGIVFLGFAGTRFTMPFAQGYMSYAVNNGARFFAFYLVMSIEHSLVQYLTIGASESLAPLGTGLPGMPAAYPILAQCAGYVLQTAILASLCWFIPNLAGSVLTGGSALSAQSMMGNLSGMVAGMQSMIANNQAAKSAAADQQRMSGNSAALSASHPTPHTGLNAGDDTMAPSTSGPLGAASLAGSSGGDDRAGAIGAGASPQAVGSGSGSDAPTAASGGNASGMSSSGSSTSGGGSHGAASAAAFTSSLGGAGGVKPLAAGPSATGPAVPVGGALQSHALASSPQSGGAPSAADENAAAQAGTSIGGLSKSEMGGVSGDQAANAAVSGSLHGIGSDNLSGLSSAATGSAQQALSTAQQQSVTQEAYEKSQEASSIRSATPTGETPTPAVQVRFTLGER